VCASASASAPCLSAYLSACRLDGQWVGRSVCARVLPCGKIVRTPCPPRRQCCMFVCVYVLVHVCMRERVLRHAREIQQATYPAGVRVYVCYEMLEKFSGCMRIEALLDSVCAYVSRGSRMWGVGVCAYVSRC